MEIQWKGPNKIRLVSEQFRGVLKQFDFKLIRRQHSIHLKQYIGINNTDDEFLAKESDKETGKHSNIFSNIMTILPSSSLSICNILNLAV